MTIIVEPYPADAVGAASLAYRELFDAPQTRTGQRSGDGTG